MKYLYGASIQGIQNFIFETSKLREITGASELIESICTDFFVKKLKEIGKFEDQNLIIGAAGNIKYIFEDKSVCEQFVYDFPRSIMNYAPGITISQAVIPISKNLDKNSFQRLEELLKVQRNKAIAPHSGGWMISERSRRTGKPGSHWKGKEVIDQAQNQKYQAVEEGTNRLLKKLLQGQKEISMDQFPFEMEHIIESRDRGWIAVVHADGNNLGQKLIKLAGEVKEDHLKDAFRNLSKRLEKATVDATTSSFSKTMEDFNLQKRQRLPIRPVLLGGDDLTMIIDGKYAIPFTKVFLKYFEEKTRKEFSEFDKEFGNTSFSEGLTACAGITFVKPNYPFHYAVELSKLLCDHAKKITKTLDEAPSSLMFHKVNSSFVDEKYSEIIERELSAGTIQFDYGPYFLKEQAGYASIDQLLEWVDLVNEKNAPSAPIRNWLSELKMNEDRAKQQMNRIIKLNQRYQDKLKLDPNGIKRREKKYTHLFDVLSLAGIQK